MPLPRLLVPLKPLFALTALALLAGCAGPGNRNAVLDELSPAPISGRTWSRIVGTYTGPIHASTERFGFEGLSAMETRLDLSGWADAPAVIFRMDKGYSTSWTMYGERNGTYTNIHDQRYGSQGTVVASSHAPNQLLLVLRRDTTANHKGTWLILTFLADGSVDVDYIGHSGWRGSGELSRVPSYTALR
jgi:hypothetical protein